VIGESYDYDLAVLKVDHDEPFPTIPIGDSKQEAVGNWVVAIGNPKDFEHTVTFGVISAKGRH
jgi:serine protease Do